PRGPGAGPAGGVEGASRFRGRRPYSATRPPGARSAWDPSPCPRTVSRAPPPGGKSDPSRGRDTRVGDRDDRGGLPDCVDGGGGRRGLRRGGAPRGTPPRKNGGPRPTRPA